MVAALVDLDHRLRDGLVRGVVVPALAHDLWPVERTLELLLLLVGHLSLVLDHARMRLIQIFCLQLLSGCRLLSGLLLTNGDKFRLPTLRLRSLMGSVL